MHHWTRRAMRSLILCALFAILLPAVLAAQPAFLVKNINTTADNPPSQLFPDVGQANGLFFFSTDDGIHGQELWRSDGTAAGTFLLADSCPGICGGFFFWQFAEVGGELYFSRAGELWKSDGSPAGTVPVPLGLIVGNLAELNGKLLLTASATGGGSDLWTSDGTVTGTVQLQATRRPRIRSSWGRQAAFSSFRRPTPSTAGSCGRRTARRPAPAW